MGRRVCLCILDGWGLAPGEDASGDATRLAATPHLDRLFASYPHTRLACSGAAVGLPEGTVGNSEVGHITIGAGRRVLQDMSLIDAAIAEGGLEHNPVLLELVRAAKTSGGALHLMGLLSEAGVHAHLRHLTALVAAASALFPGDIHIHLFTDGRDSPPGLAPGLTAKLLDFLKDYPKARVSSLTGRFHAMDRDGRYERIETAYRALVLGQGETAPGALVAIENAYSAGQTDEFITPRLIPGASGRFQPISARDAVLFFNYRADRARQLTRALTDPDFDRFARGGFDRPAMFAGLTGYDAKWPLPALFGPKDVRDTLGEVFSRAGLKQLRLAETEKYAHVTYFLNCGRETPFAGEERILIPSPRQVPTYDLIPQMSAQAIRDAFLGAWAKGEHALTVINLANADMVGHTGSLEAATQACQAVDACVGEIATAVLDGNGALIVTADHGNAEEMLTAANTPMTAHTANAVPCLLVCRELKDAAPRPGELADLAPTLIFLAGLDKPAQMTGRCLIPPTG